MVNYSDWLENLKKVWENKNYELLSSLLSEQLTYFESPFLPPLTTKKQVVDQWKVDLAKQKDIHFSFDILYEGENRCFTHWFCSFVRLEKQIHIDGVFFFKVNPKGECIYFKQWWVVKEK